MRWRLSIGHSGARQLKAEEFADHSKFRRGKLSDREDFPEQS